MTDQLVTVPVDTMNGEELESRIDRAVQASRDMIAKYGPDCGCWQRVPVNAEYDGRVLWHLCDYHDGYQDGLRQAILDRIELLEGIVRDLAHDDSNGIGGVCDWCAEDMESSLVQHAPYCLWRRAKEATDE